MASQSREREERETKSVPLDKKRSRTTRTHFSGIQSHVTELQSRDREGRKTCKLIALFLPSMFSIDSGIVLIIITGNIIYSHGNDLIWNTHFLSFSDVFHSFIETTLLILQPVGKRRQSLKNWNGRLPAELDPWKMPNTNQVTFYYSSEIIFFW